MKNFDTTVKAVAQFVYDMECNGAVWFGKEKMQYTRNDVQNCKEQKWRAKNEN